MSERIMVATYIFKFIQISLMNKNIVIKNNKPSEYTETIGFFANIFFQASTLIFLTSFSAT
jgi:succinate dehydrogenase hydrophobic anchor subunit